MKRLFSDALERLDSTGAVYAIVAFGLLVRILALVLVGGRALHSENPGYDQMALRLLRHESFSPYFPPGAPYLFLIAHKLFGGGLLVARAAVLPVYAALSFLLYGLLKEIGTRRAANLAVLAFALYPTYIRWSFSPSTEYPAAACLLAVVYLELLAIRRPSYPIALALGFFLGALALVRASSLPLIVLAPLYLLLKGRRLNVALVSLLVPLILISAWVWKAHTMTGRLILINDSNWQNFYITNNPGSPLYNTCPGGEVEWEPGKVEGMVQEIETHPPAVQQKLYRDIALRCVESRPDLFLLRTFNRFRTYWGFLIHRGEPLARSSEAGGARRLAGLGITALDVGFYWPIMILAIVFLCNFSQPFLRTDWIVATLGAALAYAAPYWISCSQPRYNFPVIPLFAVFAALLADTLTRKPWREVFEPLLRSARRRRALWLALAFFAYIQIEWIVFLAFSRS